MSINEEKMHELLGRFLNDFGATFHSAMAVIGDKLGLCMALTTINVQSTSRVVKRKQQAWQIG